jgi:hypothetical protein
VFNAGETLDRLMCTRERCTPGDAATAKTIDASFCLNTASYLTLRFIDKLR